MSKTLETNGQSRKTLASQLDRLDSILDGLSEGLDQAVAQAVLTELLTNPALREQLQRPAAAQPGSPDGPTNKHGGGKGRLAALCCRVRDKLRSACRVGAGWLRQAAQAAALAWRLAGERVRVALLAGAAATAACLDRTALAAAARRLCGAARSLASRAWGALRWASAAPNAGWKGTVTRAAPG